MLEHFATTYNAFFCFSPSCLHAFFSRLPSWVTTCYNKYISTFLKFIFIKINFWKFNLISFSKIKPFISYKLILIYKKNIFLFLFLFFTSILFKHGLIFINLVPSKTRIIINVVNDSDPYPDAVLLNQYHIHLHLHFQKDIFVFIIWMQLSVFSIIWI